MTTEKTKTIENTEPTEKSAKVEKSKKDNRKQKNKPGFITIFVCIFIALVMSVGGMFGMVSAIKGARALVKYDHVSLDEGTVNYFAAYYKSVYIRDMRITGVKAEDTAEFWQSEMPSGESYGENFNRSFREYLATLVAAANIYLNHSYYTPSDKIAVTKTVEEILKFKAEGSVDKFNEMAEKYNFDYDDFHNAAAILYKAEQASEVIYGNAGENLVNYPALCEEFLQNYSHVSLLFVKINDEMSEEERLQKQQIIDTLAAAIEAKNTGIGMQINSTMFENYLIDSDGDPAMHSRGYYFRHGSEKTAEFASEFPEIVDASIEMSVGEYRMVECSVGVCFIYKSEIVSGAYMDTDNIFFSDFYSDAALYHYKNTLRALSGEVKFNNRYDKLNPVDVPVIDEFVIREFKLPE